MAVCRFLSLASIPIYSFSSVTDNQFRMGDRTVPYPRAVWDVFQKFQAVALSANNHVVSAHLSAVKYFRGSVDERGATFSSGLEVTR